MTIREKLLTGLAIPAHPLALTPDRTLDERRQRALTRYYIASGAGGLAVGVHTTQFGIRDPSVGLFEPVLSLAAAEMKGSSLARIAGVCGTTRQAVREAETAARLGYDAALLSLAALKADPTPVLISHVRTVSEVLPVIGFYLQPDVGGMDLPYRFWRQFAEIDNVVAIKIAPFNRYRTLEVVRAVSDSGRATEIALYTGNDDNILVDLLTAFEVGGKQVRIVGGLLGHWAVWTSKAVAYFHRVRCLAGTDACVPPDLLALNAQITDANAALFDASNRFRGCIAGIHEILRRQGLLAGRWCLDPHEDLSPGQSEEIDRVCQTYPHLTDDDFVQQRLNGWLNQ